MKIGFIQDIHSNLEAFKAVLHNLNTVHKVDYIICLGDLINYGPNPNEVIELAYENDVNFILGEEEYSLLYPELFYPHMSDLARNCSEWTRNQLTQGHIDYIKSQEFNDEGGDNRCIYGEDFIAVHASIKDILPTQAEYGVYLDNKQEARDNFSILMANKKSVLFYGHTHIPMIYVYNEKTGKLVENPIEKRNTSVNFLPEHHYLVNFGSVGFSRDFKTLASYGVLDVKKNNFIINRINYDVATTLSKLEEIQAPQKVLAWAAYGGFRIIGN